MYTIGFVIARRYDKAILNTTLDCFTTLCFVRNDEINYNCFNCQFERIREPLKLNISNPLDVTEEFSGLIKPRD